MPFSLNRFTNSLLLHTDQTVADRLLHDRPAYDSLTTPAQTARWIAALMDDLDAQLGADLAKAVMEGCGRGCIGQTLLAKAKQIQVGSAGLDDLLAKLNQAHLGGGGLRREGTPDGATIHASYPRCYCGSVSKTRQPISPTYCQCSCGWYRQLFETLLGKPVKVELVDSIAHGAASCRFIITI
jgi:predicted ArsR family transcriptional regulator